MPRRTVSDLFHDVKDLFTPRRRRKSQSRRPRRYADIAAAQRRFQATASSEHPTESLVYLGQIMREGRVAPSPPAVAGSSSDHALVNPPLIDSNIYRHHLGDRAVIPIVSCATSQRDAPTGEAGEPDWCLPGAVQGAEAYPQMFTQSRSLSGDLFVVNERLRSVLSQDGQVDMYICMVQEKWWSGLTCNYSQEFTAHLLRKYQEAEDDLKHKFESTFKTFSDLTAFVMHPWMREASDSSDSEAASQQPSPETVSGPWQAPADNHLFLQPPVGYSNSSVSTGRRRRHVRRETSVMQPSHRPIDLIDPTE
ncbi:unnamed protein product [Fusarium equiseti]|uniref:Uncharacterized protein n=1 Tax=Fusarium equiseti TaxID=61235 RepID=A0A8J2NJI7_FUSEQ|nr:unnamed protein product [Fusarium equiseti]